MREHLQKFYGKSLYLLLAALFLFTLAWVLNTYLVSSKASDFYARKIQADIVQKEKDFQRLSRDTALVRSLVERSYREDLLEKVLDQNKGYAFFIYDTDPAQNPRLVFWNTQLTLPPNNFLHDENESRLVRLENGLYVYTVRSIVVSNKNYTLECLIPLQWQYFVEIENLKTEFVSFPEAGSSIELSLTPTGTPIKSNFGNTLFYLKHRITGDKENSALAIFFIFSGLFFLVIYLHRVALYLAARVSLWAGLGFLVGIIVLLRTLSYLFPGILKLDQFDLFNPMIYGSGLILASLGDLMINALLLCWIIFFVNRRIPAYNFRPLPRPWINWLIITGLVSILVLATFSFTRIVLSLISDGQISFNVTNFFNLIPYSFVGFFILAILILTYFMLAQIVLNISEKLANGPWLPIPLLTGTIGLLMLSFTRNSNIIEVNIYALAWLLVFILLMQQKILAGLNYRLKISEVLFWLFLFSFSIAALIIFENRKIEYEQRLRFAERLYQMSDPSSERLLSISLTYLDQDFLSPNFSRFRDEEQNQFLKDSIINKNFSPYLNKYDTRIYTFDAVTQPLFNEDPVSFDTLNTIFRIQGKPTSIGGLRYFEKSFDKFAYIFHQPVYDSLQVPVGHFFVLADPKRYKSDALIPELFKQNKQLVPEYSPDYSYAVYNEFELIENYHDFPFPTHLNPAQIPRGEFTTVKQNEHEILWYRPANDKVVMVVKKGNSFLEAITLFAYLFSTFLLLMSLYQFAGLLIRSNGKWRNLKNALQMSIRSQIHSTIIMVSLLSFVVIGVATILFFINRYDRNNQERLSNTIQIMVNEVERELAFDYPYDDVFSKLEVVSPDRLERILEDISQIHGTDVNLYDTAGQLRASSNPLVYNKGVLSDRMNPEAFFQLKLKNVIHFTSEEQMGRVKYFSIYCPVRDEGGGAYAYLNIPFFSTQNDLKQEISNFLVTIINLNAFIFLVAGAIAFFITNRITRSFTIIGQKMRDINLQKTNQEIQWNRSDEIGELVKEYNKMVQKLDESAEAMAKTEREGAWRQMARQVAHEIKNPLTPMKLSIQYLQKAIDNNSSNVKELTANVARTLVEQIDHLSKIASDFSQFANIGNPRNEVFDLHDVLHSLLSLYESTERLELQWHPVSQRAMLFSDRTQLNRLFTNLFQNAIDAADDQEIRRVEIREHIDGDFIIISLKDNGIGIPTAMRDKIFTPNFTTKSSGTGLGLAMSKSIAEQAQGDIWFETTDGEGTTFFVKLPLLRVSAV